MSFLVLLPFTEAEISNTVFVLYDASTKEPVSEVLLNVELNEENKQYYIEKGKDLILNLEQKDYEIKILANRQGTSGYDYYSSFSLETIDSSQIKVVYLYPVGSLYGTVKDSLDNVIFGAELNFECDEAFPVEYPKTSDSFGAFSLTIKLDHSRIKRGVNYFLIAGIIVVLVLAVLIYYFRKKIFPSKIEVYHAPKEASTEKEFTIENLPVKFGQRGQDLIKTLRDNEKRIVLFLAEQEKPVHLSLIHYKTGLSKGSLSRNIDSLESKNIIETHMEGKVRKIRLSEWFLG